MTQLRLGTATITQHRDGWLLRYMNSGSFLVGERTYRNRADAIEFCAERGLRVI